MSKKFLFGLILGLVFLVSAVLWLLSVCLEETFGWFTLGWAAVLLAGGFGLAFVLRGVFEKTVVPLKKFYIYFGAGFFVVALFALIGELSLPGKLVMPIIAVILAAAVLIAFLAVRGKKWDQGDNQNAGYKNYYQRKEEEQKKAEAEARDSEGKNKE